MTTTTEQNDTGRYRPWHPAWAAAYAAVMEETGDALEASEVAHAAYWAAWRAHPLYRLIAAPAPGTRVRFFGSGAMEGVRPAPGRDPWRDGVTTGQVMDGGADSSYAEVEYADDDGVTRRGYCRCLPFDLRIAEDY